MRVADRCVTTIRQSEQQQFAAIANRIVVRYISGMQSLFATSAGL